MASKVRATPSPTGWRRRVFRLPVTLYRWHLGWLLGGRFLLLTTRGRRSGLPRPTVVEVAGRDRSSGALFVASGFGGSSDWFRNLSADPHVGIQLGSRTCQGRARVMSPQESGRAMAQYAGRHPRAARQLMRLCGVEVDGSAADWYHAGHNFVPFVEITPVPPDATENS